MTTTAVSTTKNLDVKGIGPVELTRRRARPGEALSGAARRRRTAVGHHVCRICLPKRDTTGYSRRPIQASAAHPRPDELNSVAKLGRPLCRLAR